MSMFQALGTDKEKLQYSFPGLHGAEQIEPTYNIYKKHARGSYS
jgi:hypothetical protein